MFMGNMIFFAIPLAGIMLLNACAIIEGRGKAIRISEAGVDSSENIRIDGYLFMEESWKSDRYGPNSPDCKRLQPLIFLKDQYCLYSSNFGDNERACSDMNNEERKAYFENAHASFQEYLGNDTLLYRSINGWGKFSNSDREFNIGLFRWSDTFSIVVSDYRGIAYGDSLTLFRGNVTEKYVFRPWPLKIDPAKIPINKKQYQNKNSLPVVFPGN